MPASWETRTTDVETAVSAALRNSDVVSFALIDWPPKWSKTPWRIPGWLWKHRDGKLGDYSPLPKTLVGAATLVFTVQAWLIKSLVHGWPVSMDTLRSAARIAQANPPPVTGVPAAYTTSTTLTAAQVAGYARAAGFPEQQIPTAVAVAKAESGWNPTVRNSIGASGLWQILQSAHPELFTRYDWRDPAQNASMAFSVWERAGQSWKPWETFTNRSYLRFMEPAAPTTPPAATPAGCTPDAAPAGYSGKGAQVVAAAETQLGVSYVWGASSEDRAFDCSGLTLWAWDQQGVTLPHNSGAQSAATTHVPIAQAVPGDLLFFGSPIHHVGIYISPGKMIDAPHSGAVVRYDDYNTWSDLLPYVGRPA